MAVVSLGPSLLRRRFAPLGWDLAWPWTQLLLVHVPADVVGLVWGVLTADGGSGIALTVESDAATVALRLRLGPRQAWPVAHETSLWPTGQWRALALRARGGTLDLLTEADRVATVPFDLAAVFAAGPPALEVVGGGHPYGGASGVTFADLRRWHRALSTTEILHEIVRRGPAAAGVRSDTPGDDGTALIDRVGPAWVASGGWGTRHDPRPVIDPMPTTALGVAHSHQARHLPRPAGRV